MTEKTDKHSAEVHITEDYNTGEITIILRMFKNKRYYTDYHLDSVDVYEKTRSTTKRKTMEKRND